MEKEEPREHFIIKDPYGEFYWRDHYGWVSSKDNATRFYAPEAVEVMRVLQQAGQDVFEIELA